jgi:phosphate/sulfate permease
MFKADAGGPRLFPFFFFLGQVSGPAPPPPGCDHTHTTHAHKHSPPLLLSFSPYTWIFGVSCIVSFIAAFGIGANDVANSFASSVGAKVRVCWGGRGGEECFFVPCVCSPCHDHLSPHPAFTCHNSHSPNPAHSLSRFNTQPLSQAITLPQALVIAAVCEFSGAVLLGSGVTDTIKGGIANAAVFAKTPDLFMYGFFCVMLAAAFWDNFACHMHLPVSTTHTTVGATIGMALAIYGGNSVIWFSRKDEFPFIGGITPIFLSWIVSPLLAGIFVAALFGLLRAVVLRSPNSFARSLYVLPACVFLLFFTLAVFIYQTYLKNKLKVSVEGWSRGFVFKVCR